MGNVFSLSTTEKLAPPDRKTLEGLLRAVATGDREAFGALYRLAKGGVYALALSILNHEQKAQDVTQDVFVCIWEAAPRYRPQGSPMSWILTIARNQALMVLRQEERQVELKQEAWEAIPAPDAGPSREDSQLLWEAMSQLGGEERQVIFLHAVSGLRHREIASLLELPLSTVLSKYQRGLKKLRHFIEGEGQP